MSAPPWNIFNKNNNETRRNAIIRKTHKVFKKKNDIPFKPFVYFYCAMLFGYFFSTIFYFYKKYQWGRKHSLCACFFLLFFFELLSSLLCKFLYVIELISMVWWWKTKWQTWTNVNKVDEQRKKQCRSFECLWKWFSYLLLLAYPMSWKPSDRENETVKWHTPQRINQTTFLCIFFY